MSAGVASATVGNYVRNAYLCPDVSMATAPSHLSAYVVPAGMVFSVPNVGICLNDEQANRWNVNYFALWVSFGGIVFFPTRKQPPVVRVATAPEDIAKDPENVVAALAGLDVIVVSVPFCQVVNMVRATSLSSAIVCPAIPGSCVNCVSFSFFAKTNI